MESKAWSDQESDTDESKDTDRRSERRTPILPLGTIYQRETARAPEPVEREHERTEPEVAQSIVPGMPELSLAVPQPRQEQAYPVPPHELFQVQSPPTETLDTTAEEDDEDDDEAREDAVDDGQTTRPVTAPSPVEHETPQHTILDPEVSHAVQPTIMPEQEAETPRLVPVGVAETPVVTPTELTPAEAQVAYPQPYGTQPPVERPVVPPQPNFEQPEPQPAPYAVAATGNRPPMPPQPPEGPAYNYGQPPEQRWPDAGSSSYAAMAQPGQAYNTYPNTYAQAQQGGDTITKRDFERYQRDSRRKMAGAVLTTLAISWYLSHRKIKPLREQVQQLQKQNEFQQDKITTLEGQQQTPARTMEQPATAVSRQPAYEQQPYGQPVPAQQRFESGTAAAPLAAHMANRGGALRTGPEGRPTPPSPQQLDKAPRVIGGDGQEIVLQEGQHYERSAGGYGAVLDEHNRLVQDAIEYGESFQQDRLPERMPTPFGTQDARFKDSGALVGGGGGGGGAGGTPQATLSSGQVPQDHTLSAGQAAGRTPNEEAQHLLEAPRVNPVVSAITSPWLWLGVGVLLIAFFAAATI